MTAFRVHVDGYVYAENIDGALTLLAQHFANPMSADDGDVVQLTVEISPRTQT